MKNKKKLELFLVMLILVVLALAVCGCNEAQQIVKPDLRNELFNLSAKDQALWNEKYGDGLDSKQTANSAMMTFTINNQGKAIKELNARLTGLNARIAELEDPNLYELEVRVTGLEETYKKTENQCKYFVNRCPECPARAIEIQTGPDCPNGYDVIWEDVLCFEHYQKN